MTEHDVLVVVLREMQEVGNGWRMSWDDFDGRTLRNQLNEIAAWAKHTVEQLPMDSDYTSGTEFAAREV